MKMLPFKVVDVNGSPQIEVEYMGERKTFSPQEISAMMKEIAETKLNKKVEKAVITVPAYFSDSQRLSTKDAGTIAGLNVLRIINEPTAAAIAYGLDSKSDKEKNVLIFDLGGDLDDDPRALRRLRTACERAKRTLSSVTQTTVEIESLKDGQDLSININRARFEEINSKVFQSTLEPVEKVLKDSKIDKSKIDDIVLVGGSTRIPRIQKLVSDFFDGKSLNKSINPDECVAYGAAVQAAVLTNKANSEKTSDLLLLDVCPLSFGVSMEGNVFGVVVPRNTPIPTLKKRTFTTVEDNQTCVVFPVYQGERTNCLENEFLGEFELQDIPPLQKYQLYFMSFINLIIKRGQAELETIFELDVNGILKVTAREKSTGKSAHIEISNSVGRLSSQQIQEMINNAKKFSEKDKEFSKRVELKQTLEAYISSIESTINDPGVSMKLKKGQKKSIEDALANAMDALEIEDYETLKRAELDLKPRTIETVEGGGIIAILFKTMTNLKQLYTMTMDIHSRYRTEAHNDIVSRFNERFILSLGSCSSCLFVDDELNVLPISEAKKIKPLPPPQPEEPKKELEEFKKKYEDKQPLGSLVNAARTLDQANAVITFVDAISEKTLRSTVTLTAARGRGKSAALGLAISAAVAYGYSNIFITSPSPENLKTLFEFIFKGFDSLKYEEHLDYDIIQSINPSFNKSIVRVNIFRNHRQTIQYIHPSDAHVLGQAELLVIDEAAAIPLPLVRKLLGPYLTFMASTINGYEGTGRSLSLKLIQQLREQSRGFVNKGSKLENSQDNINKSEKFNKSEINNIGGRKLREITLEEPIRYSSGDPIEKWLNKLLCLDINIPVNQFSTQSYPHPSHCELYYVNRDTLFSYHPVSETFLQTMMSLYVASHYKNSPNDLQLMSDAPAHQLFVLLPPIKEDDQRLPEPLCVIQIALEGEISRESVINNLRRGQRIAGDLIPWVISEQYQDDKFASLSGARIVRIATNPEYIKMGYGSRALQLLEDFYKGKYFNLFEENIEFEENIKIVNDEIEESSFLTDEIKVRDPKTMPPLLLKLSQKKPGIIHYLGVSYGLTPQLYRFWKRACFVPVYLRQTPNDLTGEHTCVMLKLLQDDNENWLNA
ncbi:unnamed protein product, partial [Pneumocystis jirovecii]